MRAGESSTTIKKMQDFLDKLDKHVLNRKILGGVKVKHVVAAFMAYKALQGMGNIENAQTAGDVFAGGIQAVGAIGAGFGMVGERHLYDKPADSERTELNSTDGDRQIHPTENTQITLNSQNITLKSTTEEGGNLENGLITVNAEQISIYTNDTRTDANGNTDSPTTGSLLLNSKQIAITAVDYEQKGEDPITEKCLTDSGNITIRAKDMIIDGTDTEGKAISTTVINSKIVALTTADFDKEKGEYKAITENGQIEMAAPNILIGNSAENWESQLVQIVSNQIVEGAKTSAEILQGQDNTILKLADDKVVLSATKENELYGKKIAVNGESSFSGKMTANSINVKSLDVSGKLKAPNLEAGTGAASGGSSATFSAKVNIQEQKHEKLKYEKGKKSKNKQ